MQFGDNDFNQTGVMPRAPRVRSSGGGQSGLFLPQKSKKRANFREFSAQILLPPELSQILAGRTIAARHAFVFFGKVFRLREGHAQ